MVLFEASNSMGNRAFGGEGDDSDDDDVDDAKSAPDSSAAPLSSPLGACCCDVHMRAKFELATADKDGNA